jgi:hypothetical protein
MRLSLFGMLIAAAFTLPTQARAGCSVLSLDGQTLTVEEFEEGSWQTAAEAAKTAFDRAKAAGSLFERVYGGGYKVQAVRADMQTAEDEWQAAVAAAHEAMAPFEGTCGGELLADVLRKANKFRDPEISMVEGMLGGKPLQASQQQMHEGREEDYREYQRRLNTILENADVRCVGSSAPEASPTE